MRLTIDSVMALSPCHEWSRKRVEEYFAGRAYVRHSTPLRDQKIRIEDRIWLATKLMDEKKQRLFACDCAERALASERGAGRDPDIRSWTAVEVSRRYVSGHATDLELAAARDAAMAARAARAAISNAAWAAAMAAAWAAARDAAMDAAWAATRAAAEAAAMDAAWAAARAAAWAAARAAERQWQIERAIEYLGGGY